MKFLRLRAALAAASAVVLLASCGGSDFSEAPTPALYSTIAVMGASLSDTGNGCVIDATNTSLCPPSPPYAQARYSNGPIYIEPVAANFGASSTASLRGGTNFAIANARTGSVRAALDAAGLQSVLLSAATGTVSFAPGLNSPLGTRPSQIDALLTRFNFQLAPQTLVIIDSTAVGNAIADALTLSAVYPANAAQIGPAIVTGAVTDIVGVINRLYAAGARNIMVINAPNIGQTPAVASQGGAAAAGGTQLSVGFNNALAQQVTGLRALLSGVNLMLFDLFALEAQIKAGTAPGGFTLANTTGACFVPPAAPCANPGDYFYWDGFHPSAVLGAYVGQRVIAALATP